jgi:hypothetical protein
MKLTTHQVDLYNLLIQKKIFHNFLKRAESNPHTPPYYADICESHTSTSPKHQNILPSPPLHTTTNTKYIQMNVHTPSVSDMVETGHVFFTGKWIWRTELVFLEP